MEKLREKEAKLKRLELKVELMKQEGQKLLSSYREQCVMLEDSQTREEFSTDMHNVCQHLIDKLKLRDELNLSESKHFQFMFSDSVILY